jgi:hypothetical protein
VETKTIYTVVKKNRKNGFYKFELEADALVKQIMGIEKLKDKQYIDEISYIFNNKKNIISFSDSNFTSFGASGEDT